MANSSALQAVPRWVSYEEFLSSSDSTHAEWVNGEVIEMSPVSKDHQEILQFLQFLLKAWLESHPTGRIYIAPFQMKISKVGAGREPDLIFISQARLGNLTQNYLEGPADLAVEIVSPESVQRDREIKFREYQSCGVREYWIIDPVGGRTDFFHLGADGRYVALDADPAGIMHSRVVEGFRLRPDWLLQSPPPPVFPILREWGLI